MGELLESEAPRIDPETPAHDVSQLFQDRDLVSAAVVSKDGRLLGRITIDDVVDVIREEAEHSVLSMAGLRDEEDVFAGVLVSTKRRLFWLGINLVTAFLAGLVVQRFEGTIEKVAALAALMPIVASMGGIAGTQTVTLIIRGLALGQIEWSNARWLLFKEIARRRAERPDLGGGGRRHHDVLVRHLEDRGDHRGGDADQSARRGVGRGARAADAAAPQDRSRAVGGRDPHDVHRLHRLRDAARARRAVPDLEHDERQANRQDQQDD